LLERVVAGRLQQVDDKDWLVVDGSASVRPFVRPSVLGLVVADRSPGRRLHRVQYFNAWLVTRRRQISIVLARPAVIPSEPACPLRTGHALDTVIVRVRQSDWPSAMSIVRSATNAPLALSCRRRLCFALSVAEIGATDYAVDTGWPGLSSPHPSPLPTLLPPARHASLGAEWNNSPTIPVSGYIYYGDGGVERYERKIHDIASVRHHKDAICELLLLLLMSRDTPSIRTSFSPLDVVYALHLPCTALITSYCDHCVCLFVCLSAYISQNHKSKFYPIFCTCCLWPWLGPPLTAMWYVMYIGFVDDAFFL